MQEPIGLLVFVARRRIKQAVLRRAERHRLAPQQFWLLAALGEHPGISQAELADRVRVDAPTVCRVLATLARRRLVRMEADPRDRRRSRLRLTAAGERLSRELLPVAAEIRSAISAGMSAVEVDSLRQGLRRVIANMDRFEAGTARRDAP